MPISQHLVTLVTLETLSPIMETSEPQTAEEVNISSWKIVGAQLGEHWETAPVDIWDSLYMCM